MKTWKSYLQTAVRDRLERNAVTADDVSQILKTFAAFYGCDTEAAKQAIFV